MSQAVDQEEDWLGGMQWLDGWADTRAEFEKIERNSIETRTGGRCSSQRGKLGPVAPRGKLFDQIFIQTTIAIVASNMTRSGLLYLDQDHIYGCSLGASQANFLSYLATIRPEVAPNESLTSSPSCSR